MESRKMVQINLFAGQQWRCRPREQTCEHSVGGKMRQTGNIHYHVQNSQWEFAM